ncbi:hypothetical protein ABZ816_09015 [Actinosynnema sp. NPDC047251]|uniref:Uncharacterized protein n=1 Tax=Saccharothrix espanaensis (strain ATCC 51144 / DSM 44229 / JCM 9112 / NBRC 15066 / NRRL 15764) TaxID=1179773 RepID=K0K6J1_SACES|nr:hypothetical protein [Saccharothrix espanaensis]CCH33951.1 hypothetical protein BN6_67140 [Saccharothrix espanaensis DSM 44229]
MSRSSLTEQLVDLRRAYTGENLSQATPAVKHVLHNLPEDRRERVVDALAGRADVRGLLLPDAPTDDQRTLECVVLQSATEASSHLQLKPPASMLRPAHVFASVEPADTPRLHLAEHALGPLLYEVLPRDEDRWVAGVAGLRVERHPRSIELRLLDLDASVIVSGVDDDAWDAGMAYVKNLLKGRDLRGPFIEGPLSAAEREHLAEFPRRTGLGSAVLRRYHLFTRAPWLRSLPQDDKWWLEWPESIGVAPIADRLLHPVFGLPNAVETPSPAGGLGLTTGWYDLYLRETDPPDPTKEDALGALEWPEGVTGWWEPPTRPVG